MFEIGIVGSGAFETMDVLMNFYKSAGYAVYKKKQLQRNGYVEAGGYDDKTEITITSMDTDIFYCEEIYRKRFHNLIYTGDFTNNVCNPVKRRPALSLNKDDFIILNADGSDSISFLNGTHARSITYGFNQKASVTASSVLHSDNEVLVQCCVQRKIATYSGKFLEPQEFPVLIKSADNIYAILAASAAAMVNEILQRWMSKADSILSSYTNSY